MTITERTLKEWRRQALQEQLRLKGWDSKIEFTSHRRETAERILRLTQELLDLHLVAKCPEVFTKSEDKDDNRA